MAGSRAVTFTTSGSTNRTKSFLQKMQRQQDLFGSLGSIAQRGVSALEAATPRDTGLTASSWTYEIEVKNGRVSIYWVNTNVNGQAHVAILLQYGHGTGTGGYVQGRDYINPAMKPIFDSIANDVWEKVKSS